jgi:endonuclease/exonuclease/phosphatase family metal-dependent hydrolase
MAALRSGLALSAFSALAAPVAAQTPINLSPETAVVRKGKWVVSSDSTAPYGGAALRHPDAGAAKLAAPLASPADYFEIAFNATAGVGYRLWLYGKADRNSWANDSVFVQFSGSVTSSGSAVYRVGTTSATEINLEECSGCGLSGWAWQDNGWGKGVSGPLVYFATTGVQTMRVQTREDGLSIDHVMLSPETSSGATVPATPSLSAPGGSGVPVTPTYSWNAVAGAAQYYLWVNDSAGRARIQSWFQASSVCSSSSCAVTPSVTLAAGTTHTAWVQASNSAGTTAFSAGRTFATAGTASLTTTVLKVLDWNTHHGLGTDGTYSITRFVDWIVKSGANVVSLNEVEKNVGTYGNEDQPARYASLLKTKTGKTWYYKFAHRTGGTNGQGNLLLSTFPLEDSDSHLLSYSRSVARIQIIVNGIRVNVFSTHLDADSSTRRATQMNELKTWANSFSQQHVYAGDFNAWPGAAEIANMTSVAYDAWAEAKADGTAVAYAGNEAGNTRNSRIDYVFYSKSAPRLVLKGAQVFDTRDANGVMPSDHRPIMATFEVK